METSSTLPSIVIERKYYADANSKVVVEYKTPDNSFINWFKAQLAESIKYRNNQMEQVRKAFEKSLESF